MSPNDTTGSVNLNGTEKGKGKGDRHHFGAKSVKSEGAKRRARDEEERGAEWWCVMGSRGRVTVIISSQKGVCHFKSDISLDLYG